MRFTFWLVAAVLLSGCAGTASPKIGPGGATTAAEPSIDTDAETGSLIVQVITSELIPVEKAQVLLSGTPHTAFTDLAGSVQFNDLEPGAYTVLAAKPGYQSKSEKGKIVDVAAGEVAEIKLQLEPEQILSKENFYHSTFPFTGFVTCSFQVVTAAPQSCTRQQLVVDPNGKNQHSWTTDSVLVQSVVMEAQWQPTVGAVPFELLFLAYRNRACGTGGASCSYSDSMFSTRGDSPLHLIVREDSTGNLTRRLGNDPTKYPREHYAEMLVGCQPGCISIVVQQKYEAWVTLFYGDQAPQDWSIIPKT